MQTFVQAREATFPDNMTLIEQGGGRA